jgi:hypothetical protein
MNNNIEEIKNIGPSLANIKLSFDDDSSKDEIPNAYFESLQNRTISLINVEVESMGHDVPNGYFRSLESKVLPKKQVFSIRPLLKYASIFLLVCISITGIIHFISNPSETNVIAQSPVISNATNEEVLAILDDYVADESNFQMVLNAGLVEVASSDLESTDLLDVYNVSDAELFEE